jgi:hypothetical protein
VTCARQINSWPLLLGSVVWQPCTATSATSSGEISRKGIYLKVNILSSMISPLDVLCAGWVERRVWGYKVTLRVYSSNAGLEVK